MTHAEFAGARLLLAEERVGVASRAQQDREDALFASSVEALRRGPR